MRPGTPLSPGLTPCPGLVAGGYMRPGTPLSPGLTPCPGLAAREDGTRPGAPLSPGLINEDARPGRAVHTFAKLRLRNGVPPIPRGGCR
jgi:hypothetical protein